MLHTGDHYETRARHLRSQAFMTGLAFLRSGLIKLLNLFRSGFSAANASIRHKAETVHLNRKAA